MVCVTGDPQHDIINLRRATSPSANDCRDLLADHADMINRLSAREYVRPSQPPSASAAKLSKAGVEILRVGIEKPTNEFKKQCEAQPVITREIKDFLKNPNVREATMWQTEFGGYPPRGVLLRLVRRCGGEVHECNDFWNFVSRESFLQEAARIEQWYQHPRKQSRHRLGIAPAEGGGERVRGNMSVWTTNVRRH